MLKTGLSYRSWQQWAPVQALSRIGWIHQATELLRRSVQEFRNDHCPQLAAAISYHVLFSVFPLAIALLGIVGLVTADSNARHEVLDAVLRVVPLGHQSQQNLGNLLGSANGGLGALGLLGFVGVIWSASGVMAAVRVALNVAWDTSKKRPFLLGKAVNLALVAGIFLVIGATLGLAIMASLVRHEAGQLPPSLHLLTPLTGAAASAAVLIASAALLFLTFGLLYRFVPAVPTHVRGVWPGALTAAAGFEALQYGFSVYIAHFAHFTKEYGSYGPLGAVIAFLFFVYLASVVFLFGAEVASEYPRLRTGTGPQASSAP